MQSSRVPSRARVPMLAALASLAVLAACVDPEEEIDALGTSEQSIFANVPGAHRVTQNISWDTVAYNLPAGYALAAWTQVRAQLPENIVNAVYRDAGGCLRRRYMSDRDGIWRSDTALASCEDPGFGSDPAVVAWGPNRLDVFWFRYSFIAPPHLAHAVFDNGVWYYEDLGATATTPSLAPAATSWGVGRLDVFWVDAGGVLRRRSFDRSKKGALGYTPGGWTVGETTLNSFMPSTQIAAVASQNFEIHLVYRSASGRLAHYYTTDYYNWSFELTNIVVDTPPTVVSWGPWQFRVFARRGTTLRQIQKNGTQWSDLIFASSAAFGTPVAAAALGRPERIDFLGSPDGSTLKHTLYQESVPGYLELWNPYTSHWCWATTAGTVVNQMYGFAHPTCYYVSLEVGEDCCAANPDSSCITTGSDSSVLSAWGIDWTEGPPLTADELRFQLQVIKHPVIAFHDITLSFVNHYVVLRDIYAVNGVDYVVIADPGDNGESWVWPYSTYLAYDDNWEVTSMKYNMRF